jgi:hypothetical protein
VLGMLAGVAPPGAALCGYPFNASHLDLLGYLGHRARSPRVLYIRRWASRPSEMGSPG